VDAESIISLRCEMKIEAKVLLFDMDGTLIDTDGVSNMVWEKWALKNSISLESILKVHHGRRPEETIHLVAPHLPEKEHAAEIYEAHATITTGFELIKGSKEFFNHLPLGSIGVVTSATRPIVENRFSHTGLRLDSVIVTSEMVKKGKPDPEAYLLAASTFNIDPRDCLVFEDAPAGIMAAKAAGMKVIGVVTTHSREQLSEADYLIDDFSKINFKLVGSSVWLTF
jgi:HAD superfamily hydrolase (TIGR01509 family)